MSAYPDIAGVLIFSLDIYELPKYIEVNKTYTFNGKSIVVYKINIATRNGEPNVIEIIRIWIEHPIDGYRLWCELDKSKCIVFYNPTYGK